MSEKLVKFIGRNIAISDQLPKYVDILEQFEGYENELYSIVAKQAKTGEFTGNVEQDFAEWKRPIEAIARNVINAGVEFGIYDLTVAELVDQNPGVTQLNAVCKNTMQGMIGNLLSTVNTTIEGLDQAERQAASHVTGSGVSIWTSSLGSALIYNALEMSTIKRQCNEADKEYRSAIIALCNSTANSQKQGEISVLTNTYYPGCNAAIPVIISHMLEAYLRKIGQSGQFDYSEVRRYDMAGSVEIIKNLNVVQNKQEVLVKAFEKCPYNPDVFKELIDIDEVDLTTFEIAKYLGQSAILLPYVKAYAEKKIKSNQDTTEAVKVWASFAGTDEKGIYIQIYSGPYTEAMNRYREVVNSIKNYEACIQWTINNIADKSSNLVGKKNEIIALVSEKVRGILNEESYNKLYGLGILESREFNLTGNEIAGYEEIMSDLSKKLVKMIMNIIASAEKRISELSSEVSRLTQDANSRYQEYRLLEINLQNRIDEFQKERNNCGIFAFSRKKALDQAIESAINDKNNKLNEIKKEFDSITQQRDYVLKKMEMLN